VARAASRRGVAILSALVTAIRAGCRLKAGHDPGAGRHDP
jgi:hypothetical protein